MKKILAIGIILLFITSSIAISNNAGISKIKNEKVVATITYKSNERIATTLQPLVVITQPENGAVVTDPHLVVLGYASDEAGMNYWEWEWRYKGGSYSNSSYFETAQYVEFRIDIYGLHPGWNLVIVRFENIYGAWGEDSVNVTYNPPNHPPNKPAKPEGPIKGKVGATLYFSTVTTDPDDDPLEYLIDWGDGSNTGWLGPITSGTPFESFHAWAEPGTYAVKAKARDIPYHEESEWSEPLIVTIYGNDTEPPVVVIEYPPDGATFTEPNITVTGLITDNTGIVSIGAKQKWSEGETETSSTIEPTTNYPFEWNFTLYLGWNRITIYAEDAAGNRGEDNVTVYYNISQKIDLDVVWQTNNSELVPEDKEGDVNAHVPGRALSLNRGSNHLKKIYVNTPVGEKFTLDWSDKLEIYEDKGKTIKAQKNKQYTAPKGFWVEATKRSNNLNDQWVEATLVKDKTKKDKVVFTNFQVEITVRCSGKVSPQSENDRHDIFVDGILDGDDTLGLRYAGGLYRGAVEIVGQLLPNTLRANDFFNDEFYWRQNYDQRIYINDKCVWTNNSVADDPFAQVVHHTPPQRNDHERWQDITPSNTGKIYYVDAPGDSPDSPPKITYGGDLKAVRLRFESWCTFKYHEEGGPKLDATRNVRPTRTTGYIDCSTGHKWYILRTTLRTTGRDNDACWQGNLIKSFDNKPPDRVLFYILLSPIIRSISPKQAKIGETITVTIKGERFFNTPSVRLSRYTGRFVRIFATHVYVINKNTISATFRIPDSWSYRGWWAFIIKTPPIDQNGDGRPDGSYWSTGPLFRVTIW